MADDPKPSVVIFVANVRRMTDFYRALAAMELLVDEPDYSVLETDGFQVVVHALRSETASEVAETAPTSIRQDAYVKLCLPVASIAVAREKAGGLGGTIKPVEAEWSARGFRACDGHDPEGNVIQVREPADRAVDDGARRQDEL